MRSQDDSSMRAFGMHVGLPTYETAYLRVLELDVPYPQTDFCGTQAAKNTVNLFREDIVITWVI